METPKLNGLHSLVNNEFAEDIIKGLSSEKKYLPSKYFYDERGNELFRQIMQLDEYYLTRTEYHILESHKEDILKIIRRKGERINIIELGAGDGKKSKILLKHFTENGLNIKYQPVDISPNALQLLYNQIKPELPDLHIEPVEGDYFDTLEKLSFEDNTPRLVLFLGSTIGNFTEEGAFHFIRNLKSSLKKGDQVMIGFDLIKEPDVILKAYNDRYGITRQFNFNLLRRINQELGGNFDMDKFIHYPIYDPSEKAAKSYLISRENHTVHIRETGHTFQFKKYEPLFMEVSQKYTATMIEKLCVRNNFEIVENYYDAKKYFIDSIWELR